MGFQHRVLREPIVTMSGMSEQADVARVQRASKAQPAPSCMIEGVEPGICRKRCPGVVVAGTESSKPRV